MSWKDSLVINLAKIRFVPKSILDVGFIKLRDRYLQLRRDYLEVLLENRKLRAALKKHQSKSGDDDPSPTTPSSQIPPWDKTNKKGGGVKNGRKDGHKGETRGRSNDITHTNEALPEKCSCGGECGTSYFVRDRVVEDIEEVRVKRTKVSIFAARCQDCGKVVEGVVPDVLKGNQVGNQVLVWSVYLHFFIGTSCRNVAVICNKLLSFPLSAGALCQNWDRIADILEPAYQKLVPYLKEGGYVHSDETGWRVFGSSWWVWCFTNNHVCFYLIDKSRGSQVIFRVLGDFFDGVLISDFFSAYGLLKAAAKQKCFSHLFTEMKKCLLKDDSESLRKFCKVLKRILKDAMQLKLEYKQAKISKQTYDSRLSRLEKRLGWLIQDPAGVQNANVHRLRKRIRKYRNELFTFLRYENVEATNNTAEQRIRLIALQRKISFGSYSKSGVRTRYILVSLIQTCKITGVDFVQYACFCLNEHIHRREIPGIHEYAKMIPNVKIAA